VVVISCPASQPDFGYDNVKKKKRSTNPRLLSPPYTPTFRASPFPCQLFFYLLMKRKRRVYVSKVSKSESKGKRREPKKKKKKKQKTENQHTRDEVMINRLAEIDATNRLETGGMRMNRLWKKSSRVYRKVKRKKNQPPDFLVKRRMKKARNGISKSGMKRSSSRSRTT
jgi:hypothetical protein